MKLSKIALAIAVISLTLAVSPAFAQTALALNITSAVLHVGGPDVKVELDAFCNSTPCNLSWSVILSTSKVGWIDNTNGPTTNFSCGPTPGTAIVVVKDDQGHKAFATITVLK